MIQALTTLEAHLVPFESSGDAFFRGVYGFAAFGTLGVFYWLKRHFVCTEKQRKIFDYYLDYYQLYENISFIYFSICLPLFYRYEHSIYFHIFQIIFQIIKDQIYPIVCCDGIFYETLRRRSKQEDWN